MDFPARLAALVPAPRRHVLRYHGTLAPNAKWRRMIVPKAPAAKTRPGHEDAVEPMPTPSRTSKLSWADLMMRVFESDVLACVRCNGRLKIVATVTSPTAVTAILECLGLPARPPPLAAAREQKQTKFGFEK